MIHQSGFSWNTRGITIYSFSDVTTIIHQTKYQLYLFNISQFFTSLSHPNPTHPHHDTCCHVVPLVFFSGTNHIFPSSHHPTSQGAGMANAVLPELRTMPSTSNTRSSSAENHSELAKGSDGVRWKRWQKNVVENTPCDLGKGSGGSRIDMDFCVLNFFWKMKAPCWVDFLEAKSTDSTWFFNCHRFLQLQFDRHPQLQQCPVEGWFSAKKWYFYWLNLQSCPKSGHRFFSNQKFLHFPYLVWIYLFMLQPQQICFPCPGT